MNHQLLAQKKIMDENRIILQNKASKVEYPFLMTTDEFKMFQEEEQIFTSLLPNNTASLEKLNFSV